MTKLSHSRSGSGSTAPWSLRMIVRRSSESSVAYVFGTSIGRGGSPGGRCQKRPRCGPGGDVGDDVDLLARLLERALEREVVVRRHDELVRRAALAQERRQLGEETMERAWLDRRLEAARAARRRAGPSPASSRRTARRARGRPAGRPGLRTRSRDAPRGRRHRRGRARDDPAGEERVRRSRRRRPAPTGAAGTREAAS